MPEATVTDANEDLLPEDVLFKGALIKVDVREQSWDDKWTGQRETAAKWIWHFKITDGQYAGKSARGETFATMKAGGQGHDWITALAGGVPPVLGQTINTDNYIGQICMFEVSHRTFTGRNGEVTLAEVSRVYALDASAAPSQPPF